MQDAELLRYSRHILLDEMGIEGQQRIQAAHVLVIGAGGLGCPAALYLAAAGVGTLTIVDDDVVDLTNLQRQILHSTARVGLPKVLSAQTALHALNPLVKVVALQARAQGDALTAWVQEADVVVDCSDNFSTRQAVNAACVQAQKPLVFGAALKFDGQLAVFDRRKMVNAAITAKNDARAVFGNDAHVTKHATEHAAVPLPHTPPCYACLFPPEQNFEEAACSSMGVFAPLTGIIGSMQAAEALKLIAMPNMHPPAQLLLFDARVSEWTRIHLTRNPRCSVCAHTHLH